MVPHHLVQKCINILEMHNCSAVHLKISCLEQFVYIANKTAPKIWAQILMVLAKKASYTKKEDWW